MHPLSSEHDDSKHLVSQVYPFWPHSPLVHPPGIRLLPSHNSAQQYQQFEERTCLKSVAKDRKASSGIPQYFQALDTVGRMDLSNISVDSVKNTLSNLSLYDIKAAARKAQNVVMNYTEMEAKVHSPKNLFIQQQLMTPKQW